MPRAIFDGEWPDRPLDDDVKESGLGIGWLMPWSLHFAS